MVKYTRTKAGGWVKGGPKAASRHQMKGPRRDGLRPDQAANAGKDSQQESGRLVSHRNPYLFNIW